MRDIIPFHSFIFKISSRCNLNCSYCYVYNLGDDSWKRQPKFISQEIFKEACVKIRKHCGTHSKNEINIAFHGGEPLLIGIDRLKAIGGIIKEELISKDITVNIGMQTNGLLFNEEIGDFFLEYCGTIGISIDGPPEINDLHRVDHKGRGSSYILSRKIELISSEKYKSIFRGFLSVINVQADPIKVITYLLSFNPLSIDLLFPDDNYDRLPKGKEKSFQTTLISDWLIQVFDYWYYGKSSTTIRIFENIIKLLLGGKSSVESIGTTPVDFTFIEANGDIELLDTLKSTYNGATLINHNVFNNSFDEVALLSETRIRQLGIKVLCDTCQNCKIVNVCGGGYLPNRYSSKNNFNNPSIYCADLKKLIAHIYNRISLDLSPVATNERPVLQSKEKMV